MATTKEVKVVINGEEYVSKAARDASAGMDGFGSKIPGWAKVVGALTVAWQVAQTAIRYLRETVQDSFRAFDDLERSQRKLEGTSKLTGIALEDLNVIAEVGKRAFGLSTVTAREFATEIGKLGEKAGDTTKSKEALQAFLDLGASRGLTATETLKALQQSLLGIDEGTDKLFGKNPSGLWADYESVIGKAAGKFSDADKAAALLHAALEGGERVIGSYREFLDTTAGKTDQLAQKTEESKARIGESLELIRGYYLSAKEAIIPGFYDLFRRAVDDANRAIYGWQSVTYVALGAIAKALGDDKSWVEYAVKAKEASEKSSEWARKAGMSAEELAESTKKYGGSLRDVIPNIDKTRDSLFAVKNPLDAFTTGNDKAADAVGKVGPRAKMTKEEVEKYTHTTKLSAEEIAKAKKAEEKAWDEYVAKIKAWHRILGEETVKYQEVLKTMKPALDKAFDLASIEGYNKSVKAVKESADEAVAKMKEHGDLPPLVKKAETAVKGLSDELFMGAQTALDVGDAFGVIDDKAKIAMTSTMNVAGAISKMMTGGVTFAGVSAVIGGVASIVSNMMQGDAERKRLTRENTDALRKLREDGVRLSTSASGDQISGVSNALTPELVNQLATMTTATGRTAGNSILVQALAKAGLRLSDLDAVAKDLGMNLRRENGQIDLAQLPLLLEALQGGGVQDLMNIGSSFGDRLEFFREGQDLRGITGVDAAKQLFSFLGQQGVSAFAGIDLNNPAAARQQLLALFDRLDSPNSLAPGLLGPATGDQLRSLIGDMIRLLGDTPSGAGSAPSGGSGGDVITGPGGVTVPVSTSADILAGITAQTAALATYHTDSLGYLSRITDATETSAEVLQRIDVTLTTLVDGGVDAINAKLEDARRRAEFSAGRFPS